ncbi:MAG: 4Fe-4S binding protein [Epsilonproteobacteria bacterium]|nr:4Fe-4S binding protein [Campylobacterota bacterium]
MAKKQILAPSMVLTFLLYISLPWVSFDGIHLLMFHFEQHRFEFLFMAFEASTHQLIYIIVTLFIGLILTLNFTLSRFFCGYYCPSSIASVIHLRFKNPFVLFGVVFFLAFSLAFSTIAYFTPPFELLRDFTDFGTAPIFVGIIATLFTSIFLLFRGWYCSILCPYYFVSAILPQEAKQTFEFKDKESCIDCNKCVKICPVDDLDIKNGFDMRCVQCGLCEVACEDVMMKHSKKHSLISKKIANNSLWNSFSKKGYLFGIITFVFMVVTIYYILDTSMLDYCYFENKVLYK